MGFFDIFKKSEKPDVGAPYAVRTSFTPVRLGAHKIESSELRLFVKNQTNDALLTSVTVTVPKALSVDKNGIPKVKEIRLEFLQSGEEREISVPIWSNVTTDVGTYPINIQVTAHYRSYAYVLNSMKVLTEIRVV